MLSRTLTVDHLMKIGSLGLDNTQPFMDDVSLLFVKTRYEGDRVVAVVAFGEWVNYETGFMAEIIDPDEATYPGLWDILASPDVSIRVLPGIP